MYQYKIVTNIIYKKIISINDFEHKMLKKRKVHFKDEVVLYEYSYKKKYFNLNMKNMLWNK